MRTKCTLRHSFATQGRAFHFPLSLNPHTIDLTIPLLGKHQIENAAIAYTALSASGLEISDQAVKKGFAGVKWPARFQVARREPPLIFDSAHNEDSFEKLHQTLQEHFPGRAVILIFGASEDKNILGMFSVMKPAIRHLIVTRADHPRALEPERILELAREAGLEAEAVTPVASAFRRALDLSAKDGSIVLSAGSMFVTAEVMEAWNKIALTPTPSPIRAERSGASRHEDEAGRGGKR